MEARVCNECEHLDRSKKESYENVSWECAITPISLGDHEDGVSIPTSRHCPLTETKKADVKVNEVDELRKTITEHELIMGMMWALITSDDLEFAHVKNTKKRIGKYIMENIYGVDNEHIK